MPFLKSSFNGEVMIDHRASPGTQLVGEGKVMHAATLGCPHCGSVVVLNRRRVRARAHCFQCNQYICDICDAVRHDPDYIHRTMRQIAELVVSGKVTMSGSMSRPVLTPTGERNG